MKAQLDYYSPANFFRNNEAYSKFSPLFDLNLTLFNESEKLKDKISGLKIITWEQDAASLIFLNCQNLVISILSVCNEGVKETGLILLRSLFEKFIHIKYIIKYELGRQFLLYSIIAKKRFYDLYEENFPDNESLFSSEYREFRDKLNGFHVKIQNMYSNNKGRIRYRWCAKTTRRMAIDLGERLSYDYIFQIYSGYVHCDPSSMEGYISEKPGNTIFDNSPKTDGIDEILHLTEESFGRIVAEWAGTFHVEVPETFSKYIRSKNT